jgi:hypothetical protein
LIRPDGTKIDLTQNAKEFGLDTAAGTFRYSATRVPGLYCAKTPEWSDEPLDIPFYVAPALEELLANQMTDESRLALTEIAGFDVSDSGKKLGVLSEAFWSEHQTTSSAASGQPIWHWIVLALLALLLMELLLAGRIGQQRGGAAPSATRQLNLMQQTLGQSDSIDLAKSESKERQTASVR